MVVFLDSPEKYASPETLCVLEQQMAACTKLHQYIQEMDEQIQVNPQVELLNSLNYTALNTFTEFTSFQQLFVQLYLRHWNIQDVPDTGC